MTSTKASWELSMAGRAFQSAQSRSASTDTHGVLAWRVFPVLSGCICLVLSTVTADSESWSQGNHIDACCGQECLENTHSLWTEAWALCSLSLASLSLGFLVCIMKMILESSRNTQGSDQHSAPARRPPMEAVAGVSGSLTLSWF